MLAVRADALALPGTYEQFAAHEATAALLCVLALGFGFFVEVQRVAHRTPSPGASILLTRYCSVNGFTDSEKAERSGRQATDLQVPASRILDAEVAGSGVMDLQGQWWCWALKCGDFGCWMEDH